MVYITNKRSEFQFHFLGGTLGLNKQNPEHFERQFN